MKNKKKYDKITLKIMTIFFLFILFSCENIIDSEQYEKLKTERDSLREIVNEINNKYVFDSVKVRTIANTENSHLPNSEYKMEFYFIGYNSNSYYADYDTIVDGEKINGGDTLKPINGIIHFNKTLKKGENKIEGFISANNKYGKSLQGVLYDVIKTTPE